MSALQLHRVKEFRLKKGWSQDHLALVSALSKRTIQRIETGALASLETANALAGAFNLAGPHELCAAAQNNEPIHDMATEASIHPAQSRVPLFFENKPTHKVIIGLLAGTVLFLTATLVVVANLLLIWFAPPLSEKEVRDYGTIFPIMFGLMTFFSLFNQYNEYRTAKDKGRPGAEEERLPLLIPYPKMTQDGPKGFFDFIRGYPVRRREFPVGINRHNNNMILTTGSTGTLMIGEEGSGLWLSVLGQLYPLFCMQHPGLMVLPREHANLLNPIKSVLSTIGRVEDLHILSEGEAESLSRERILQSIRERKILVYISSGKASFLSHQLLTEWLETLSEPLPHKEQIPAFLCVSDADTFDAKEMRLALKRARNASALHSTLVVSDPEAFASEDAGLLMGYFHNKHVMRIHNAASARKILTLLWGDGALPVSPSYLLTLRAGHSVYIREGICWDHLMLTYLGEDLYHFL